MKNILALFILCSLLFQFASASSSTKLCKNSYPAFKPNNLLNNDILIEANKTEMTGKEVFNLFGNVQVSSKNYSFKADDAFIDTNNNLVIGNGNVSFLNDFLYLKSKKIDISDEALTGDYVEFSFIESGSNGTAKKINYKDKNTKLINTTFSNCNSSSQDWTIKSSELTLNEEKNLGIAKNATLSFFGLPIFYHPELTWPLKGRGSGFLSPTFSKYKELQNNNSSEYKISIPYYFNIAKDRDLLIKVENLSSRGNNLYSKYRQLIGENLPYVKAGNFEIENQFLENDKISFRNRWFNKFKGEVELENQTFVETEISNTSDSNYFSDIFSDGSTKRLLSYLSVTHDSEDIDFRLQLEDEEILNNGTNSFLNFPKLEIRKKLKNKFNPIDLYINATNFKNKDLNALDGQRFHIETSLEKSIHKDNFLFTPTLKLYNSKYSLNNNTEYNRSISNLSLKAESFYHESYNFRNKDYFLSLTPRIAFNYTSKEQQNMLPNFDSERIVIDSYNLFNNQNFSGYDRINNDKSLAYGLESIISDNDFNSKVINFSIGQKYFLNNSVLNLDGNFENQKSSSNIYSDLSLTSKNKNLAASISYNPYNKKIDMSSLAYNYQESPKKLLGIAYVNDDKESIKINGSYPINENLHFFGSTSKFINSSRIHKNLLGFAYETCCWEARIVKTESDSNLLSNSLEFELVFKDLASTSPMLKDKIKQQIPNYLNLYD